MACWACPLALVVSPVAANAAERVQASAWLTLEPSVGATLSAGLSEGLLLQIGRPGARKAVRPGPDMPGLVLSIEGTEVLAESAVSLRVEHRAGSASLPDTEGDTTAGGALLILAQFN